MDLDEREEMSRWDDGGERSANRSDYKFVKSSDAHTLCEPRMFLSHEAKSDRSVLPTLS